MMLVSALFGLREEFTCRGLSRVADWVVGWWVVGGELTPNLSPPLAILVPEHGLGPEIKQRLSATPVTACLVS